MTTMEQKGCCPFCIKKAVYDETGVQICANAFCDCHGHSSQNSEEVHFGTTNDAHADCKNSGDWEAEFDTLVGLEMVGNAETYKHFTTPMAIKGFMRLELYRAERRVRDELREKILEEMGKIVHRDLPLWSQIRDLVLNLL